MLDGLSRGQSLHIGIQTSEFRDDGPEDLEDDAAASAVVHANGVCHEDEEGLDNR